MNSRKEKRKLYILLKRGILFYFIFLCVCSASAKKSILDDIVFDAHIYEWLNQLNQVDLFSNGKKVYKSNQPLTAGEIAALTVCAAIKIKKQDVQSLISQGVTKAEIILIEKLFVKFAKEISLLFNDKLSEVNLLVEVLKMKKSKIESEILKYPSEKIMEHDLTLTEIEKLFDKAKYSILKGKVHEALSCYKKIITMDKKNIDALISAGILCQYLKDFSKAVSYYEDVLKLKPDNIEVRIRVADIKIRLKLYKEAELLLKGVLNERPALLIAGLRLGALYIRMRRVNRAIIVYKQLIQRNPDKAEVFEALAIAYAYKSDLKNAIKYFRKALQIEPARINSAVYLARLLKQQGFYKEALNVLNSVLENEPYEYEVLFEKASILIKTKKLDDAFRIYKNILKLVPDDMEAQASLARVYELKERYDDALRIYKNIIRQNPASDFGYISTGAMYLRKKEFARAYLYFKEALKVRPLSFSAILGKATALLFMNKFTQAAREFRRALSIVSDSEDALLGLAKVYEEMGDLNRAERFYKQVLNYNSTNLIAIRELAKLYESVEMYKRAETYLNMLFRLTDDSEIKRRIKRLNRKKDIFLDTAFFRSTRKSSTERTLFSTGIGLYLTDRLTLQSGYSFKHMAYPGFTSIDDNAINIGLTYRLTPNLLTDLYYMRNSYTNIDVDSHNFFLQLLYKRGLTLFGVNYIFIDLDEDIFTMAMQERAEILGIYAGLPVFRNMYLELMPSFINITKQDNQITVYKARLTYRFSRVPSLKAGYFLEYKDSFKEYDNYGYQMVHFAPRHYRLNSYFLRWDRLFFNKFHPAITAYINDINYTALGQRFKRSTVSFDAQLSYVYSPFTNFVIIYSYEQPNFNGSQKDIFLKFKHIF